MAIKKCLGGSQKEFYFYDAEAIRKVVKFIAFFAEFANTIF